MAENTPLAVYIHWPFCARKCPYCDYNSHVREQVQPEEWADAYIAALHRRAPFYPNREIHTVFFGGGTPSLMPPSLVKTLLQELGHFWPLHENAEITLEANPAASPRAQLEGFREAGINRLSVGVQSLDDADLRFLGRDHSAADALTTLKLAAEIFPRWSADVIYGLPHQTLEGWQAQCERLFTLNPKHVSLYQLSIEPNTAFYQRERQGKITLPPDTLQLAFYQQTLEFCRRYGLHPYEISSAAVAGEECRHNLMYWNYQEYFGLGPGAHGRMQRFDGYIAEEEYRAPERWLREVQSGGTGLKETQILEAPEIFSELLLAGLRTKQGLAKQNILRMTGKDLEEWISKSTRDQLMAEGLITENTDFITTTPEGWAVLNFVEEKLLSAV